MNLLLVEDEDRVADFIVRGLAAEGWLVERVASGEAALEALRERGFDAVILDLMLPGISGQDVCRTMRARKVYVPVLMLTALDARDERIAGLRLGADDYLAKPFDFDELVARIEALVRRETEFRGQGRAPGAGILEHGAVRFDATSARVEVDGESVELTARERELLKLFLLNPGRVLARERVLNALWGTQQDPLTNIVDVYVARLRKKLGPAGAGIVTVRGLGYRLDS